MDAYEKLDCLKEALKHIRMAEEAIDGTEYADVMCDFTDAANDIIDEMNALDFEIMEANREQAREQERDYYAAVI